MLLGVAQVEDGVCVPGLSIKQIASTADVEAVMCSASAQQHSATSHLVLSVYVACKDRTTGEFHGFFLGIIPLVCYPNKSGTSIVAPMLAIFYLVKGFYARLIKSGVLFFVVCNEAETAGERA